MKKKALSVILSVAILSTPVSASAEEVDFIDGTAMEETVAPEEAGLSGEETFSSAEEVPSIEESDVQDVENEPSDQSEEAPDIIEEVSDSSEEVSLFEDNYDEVQVNDIDLFDGDGKIDDRQVTLFHWPEKTLYVYEKVKSVDDFDLTGLSIKVTTGDSEEVISFTRNGEKKQDSKGNYYECEISAESGEDTEEIVSGIYDCRIWHDKGDSRHANVVNLRVLPAVNTATDAARQENGVYTATAGEMDVVKLVPEESGEFTITDMVKHYGTEEEDVGSVYVVDGQSMEFMSFSTFVLEKGKVYYLYPWDYPGDDRNRHSLFINPVSQGNSGVCGANVSWKIENGVLTLSGFGPTYGYWYNDRKPWSEGAYEAEKVVIEEGITSIGSCMFLDFTKLKSVQIAESVEMIDDSAFGWCENLQNIFIPKNVKKIGSAFVATTNKFDHIEVDKDNPYYSSVDGILYNKDQTDLVFVPGGKIECNISSKVVSIAGIGIAGLDLKPDFFAFRDCRFALIHTNSALQNITVAPDNTVLASVNGALYTKDKSMLLTCPPKKQSLVVAEETKVIGCDAVSGCKDLVSVTLPDGLEEIHTCGFSDCTNLREIEIPENAKLEDGSFTEKDTTLLRVHPNSDGERYARENGFRYEIIHTHNWGAGVVTKAATCTENGIRTYTCAADGETRTEIIPATGHKYGAYTVTKEPTIFAAGTESRECAVCHNREEQEIPKLTAQVKLVSKTLPMQVKKSVSGKKLIADKKPSDRIASLATSNGKVVAVNNKTFKITAKKAGKAVITVTMKSGAASKITVNVKKGKVVATKITGVKKKLNIKKGKKLTLMPVLSPITSTDKLTYSSSDEEIATVSSKGVIKAIKKGKVKVKVKAGKKTVTCVVTVK
ncbi:leucine-rich repeat protein [Blautia glucerasea]|uniref:leucine-rich repeat protein n=1 Tax=Blautia glucerasea TaxID=536633 RepID=UPI00156DE0F5|nr:leucine-rich repeat domain-containing protein [Blautia glucerasea]NSJ28345.1 leucine-rich repeat protein [Blautia glucerasea]